MIRRMALLLVLVFTLCVVFWCGAWFSVDAVRNRVMRESERQFFKQHIIKFRASTDQIAADNIAAVSFPGMWGEVREKVLNLVPYTTEGYLLLREMEDTLAEHHAPTTACGEKLLNELDLAHLKQVDVSDVLLNVCSVGWGTGGGCEGESLLDAHALRVLLLVQAHALLAELSVGSSSPDIQEYWFAISNLSGIAAQIGAMTYILHTRKLWDVVETLCSVLDDASDFQDTSRRPPLQPYPIDDLQLNILAHIHAFAVSAWDVWSEDVRASGFLYSMGAQILEPLYAYRYWNFLDELLQIAGDEQITLGRMEVWSAKQITAQGRHTAVFTGPSMVFLATLRNALEQRVELQQRRLSSGCLNFFASFPNSTPLVSE